MNSKDPVYLARQRVRGGLRHGYKNEGAENGLIVVEPEEVEDQKRSKRVVSDKAQDVGGE